MGDTLVPNGLSMVFGPDGVGQATSGEEMLAWIAELGLQDRLRMLGLLPGVPDGVMATDPACHCNDKAALLIPIEAPAPPILLTLSIGTTSPTRLPAHQPLGTPSKRLANEG